MIKILCWVEVNVGLYQCTNLDAPFEHHCLYWPRFKRPLILCGNNIFELLFKFQAPHLIFDLIGFWSFCPLWPELASIIIYAQLLQSLWGTILSSRFFFFKKMNWKTKRFQVLVAIKSLSAKHCILKFSDLLHDLYKGKSKINK